MGWAIALHGGAGDIPLDLPAERREPREAVLRHCLNIGVAALKDGRTALDVVELVVRGLENAPNFNAGKGSVLTSDGTAEMEACIMDGRTKNCGAVSGLTTVLNPISLARLVMEKTPHIYLAFDGAEAFAREQGVETADKSHFVTFENIERLKQAKEANRVQVDYTQPILKELAKQTIIPNGEDQVGTVGCVAIDINGDLATATSTGGLVNKMVGRIGDTPVIGAGTYANSLCAVSATGRGEAIIKSTVARDVAALMEYKNFSLKKAAAYVIEECAPKGTAGLVAVSAKGEITMPFNTTDFSLRIQNEVEKEAQQSNEELEKCYRSCNELFSTLPKEKGWMFEHVYRYQGFWYNLKHGVGVMAVQQHFKARSTDVLLISTPKSGTIWLKAILFAIMNRTHYHVSNHPLLTNNPHDLVPFLEMQVFVKPPVPDVEKLPSPRLFATHIPFVSLSDTIIHSGCKIVYICRNPKDVVVSMWKFMSKLREENLSPFSLQEAYDLFSKGVSEFGPFWDHVEGYKKASLEWPERVFFITYEAMKMEPSVNMKRLAKFIGHPFTIEEETDGLVEEILKLCSFENLRNLEVNKRKTSFRGTNDVFFREGKVGDWQNHLTTEMIEHLDRITKDKLNGLFPLSISNC